MASRRVAKTAVDWLALGEKVPIRQKETFRVLKASTDKYMNRLSDLPEALPKIDFADYKKRVSNAAFVSEFEKLYNALDIPYPKDTTNISASLKAAEQAELKKTEAFIAEKNARSKELNTVLEAMDSVPPPEKMTMQMYNHYFPEAAVNPNRDNPGFFPQYDRSKQFDQPEFGSYYNTRNDRKLNFSVEEREEVDRLDLEEKKADKLRQLAEEKSGVKK